MAAVHELMAEGRHEAALTRLDALRPQVVGNRYERAVLLQTYGYLHAARGDQKPAIASLREALSIEVLPRQATTRALYLLARLQLARSDAEGAVTSLERLLRLDPGAGPDAHALAGIAYGHAGRHADAAVELERAIAAAEDPEEGWFLHLLRSHRELGRPERVVALLEELIDRYPGRNRYWLQLGLAYRALGDDRKGLAAMELAHRLGAIDDEPGLLDLVRLCLFLRVPSRAARVLASALESGLVAGTGDNWGLLGEAWLQSGETARALAAMERAAAVAEDGRLHLRRAEILAQALRWDACLAAIEAALHGGALRSPGEAHLLAGLAHRSLGDPEEAMRAFDRARRFPAVADRAERWLDHLRRAVSSPAGGDEPAAAPGVRGR
jgi:tetratricopeptide (TPR) repeat protein